MSRSQGLIPLTSMHLRPLSDAEIMETLPGRIAVEMAAQADDPEGVAPARVHDDADLDDAGAMMADNDHDGMS